MTLGFVGRWGTLNSVQDLFLTVSRDPFWRHSGDIGDAKDRIQVDHMHTSTLCTFYLSSLMEK